MGCSVHSPKENIVQPDQFLMQTLCLLSRLANGRTEFSGLVAKGDKVFKVLGQ
jgi:hypothetical protein